MKKRILSLVLVLSMLCAFVPVIHAATITDSGTCGDNLTWTFNDDGTLTISGTGDMEGLGLYTPWYSSRDSIKSVIIENGVTSIGNWAFRDCSSLADVYYGGSEEEWNDISIGDYNDELLNATIHYNAIGINPPQISNLTLKSSIVGSGITDLINVQLADTEYDSEITAAFYKNSVFVDIQTIPVKTGDEEKDIPIPDGIDADSAKVFIWNSFGSMKPLCEAKSIGL